MRKQIFIAAHARSGSTYLCQLLSCFKDIKVYLEIFHYSLDQIASYLGDDSRVLLNFSDGSLSKQDVRNNLVFNCKQYLDVLKNANHNKMFAFKVFPEQLPPLQLKEVLLESKLVLLLRRNILHSYISTVIANNISLWGGVDTSEFKITFNKFDFEQHLRNVFLYYESIYSACENNRLSLTAIDYESLDQSDNSEFFLSRLSDILFDNFGKRFEYFGGNSRATRQDNRKFASDKVCNADEMLDYLKKNDLEMLNNSDLSYLNIDFRTLVGKCDFLGKK